MRRTLLDRAGRIEQLESVEKIWAETTGTLARHGLDCLIYLTVDADGIAPLVLTNVPGVYEGSDPTDDPFLTYACDSYDIMRVGPDFVPTHEMLTDAERQFIRNAKDSGFRTGFGLPMRLRGSQRYGGFLVGCGLDRAEFEARLWPWAETVRLFCLLVHRRIEELGHAGLGTANDTFRDLLVAPALAGLSALSPRESEVIFLLAQGITRKEAARLCGISPNTVADYTKSAYRKLGVQNRVEAARLVLAQAG